MNRSQFMSREQQAKWGFAERQVGQTLPRTHQNCIRITGVARPGKTAKDRQKGH